MKDFSTIVDFICSIFFITIELIQTQYTYNDPVFDFLHHFKVIYVFRGIRLLQLMEYMHVIIFLIKTNYQTFIYGHFLLFLVTFMFALFGYNFFSGKFQNNNYNFNLFSSSFMTVFNVITLENWYIVYINCSSYKNSSKFLSIFYFLSLIILGHFIIYHLFLAIMLDAFESMKNIDLETRKLDDEIEHILYKYLKKCDAQPDTVNNSTHPFKEFSFSLIEEEIEKGNIPSSNNLNKKYFFQNKNSMKPSIGSFNSKNVLIDGKLIPKNVTQNNYEEIPTEFSLFYFSKKSKIRIICFKINNFPLFGKIVFLFICTSTVKLIIETFYDKRDNNLTDPHSLRLKNISIILSFLINIFLTFAIMIKIITFGFMVKPKSYCKDKLNVANLIAVTGFYLNLIFKSNSRLQIIFEVCLNKYYFVIFSLIILKISELLRMFAPLRLVYKNKKMRIILNSLIESIYAILNVIIALLFIWYILIILIKRFILLIKNKGYYLLLLELFCTKIDLVIVNHS